MKSGDYRSAGRGLLISGSPVRAGEAEPNTQRAQLGRTHTAAYRQRCGISSAALAFMLAGCSSVPRAELAWQALHAVDVAQTVQIARSDCFWEDDPITSKLIGEHPSTGEAIAWGVAWGGLHLGVTRMLEAWEAPRWAQVGWQALTIGNTLSAVKNNIDQGILPWDSDC